MDLAYTLTSLESRLLSPFSVVQPPLVGQCLGKSADIFIPGEQWVRSPGDPTSRPVVRKRSRAEVSPAPSRALSILKRNDDSDSFPKGPAISQSQPGTLRPEAYQPSLPESQPPESENLGRQVYDPALTIGRSESTAMLPPTAPSSDFFGQHPAHIDSSLRLTPSGTAHRSQSPLKHSASTSSIKHDRASALPDLRQPHGPTSEDVQQITCRPSANKILARWHHITPQLLSLPL